MNSNTLSFSQMSNIAVFKTESFNGAKDYLHAFDKLFLTLIAKKNYADFTSFEILEDFESFYCLNLTNMFVSEFLKRLCSQGYIKKRSDDFVVVKSAFEQERFIEEYNETQDLVSIFNKRFVEYCHSQGSDLNVEDAERIICDYIECSVKQSSIKNIIFDTHLSSVNLYLFDSFLKDIEKEGDSLFETYKKICLGRIFASVMAENDIFTTDNNLCYNNLCIYLDSDFMFNLLGLNPNGYSEEYIDMVNTLKKLGAKLYIFNHTFQEMRDIISNAIDWIGNPAYDPLYASKTLIYFVTHRIGVDEARTKFYELESEIRKLGIEIDNDFSINYNEGDSLFLQNITEDIKVEYQSKTNVDLDRELTYEYDAKSIFSIHKMRKGRKSTRLKDIGFIFVTHNKALCKVAQKLNAQKYDSKTVPCAMTDTLLNVLLWFGTKQYNEKTNLMFLIPSAYYAFEPSTALLEKMNTVFETLKQKGAMTDEAIFDWRSDQILQQNIIEYTQNNPDNFDETTPNAIIRSRTTNLENKIASQRLETKTAVEPYVKEHDKQIAKKIKTVYFLEKVLPYFVIYPLIIAFFVGVFIGLHCAMTLNEEIPLLAVVLINIANLVAETVLLVLLSLKNKPVNLLKKELGRLFSKTTRRQIDELKTKRESLIKLY